MTLLVFTYAPAGLGHLRVTEALVSSKPKKYQYLLLGSSDKLITQIHRFFSTSVFGKWLFTTSQYGLIEDWATWIYKMLLFGSSKPVYRLFKDIIDRHKDIDEVWVIASHFGLAHQFGLIKQRLIEKTGRKVRLVVQVTDDTSQHIWCVRGADITFVPSLETKKELKLYSDAKKMNLKYIVSSYPLCESFMFPIKKSLGQRSDAYQSENKHINIAVPVSGAAVGLKYILRMIKILSKKSSRFRFYIVSKRSRYTEFFLKTMATFSNVYIKTGKRDIDVVKRYESVYQKRIIHLEVTKPSEQAFKAILPPKCVGGSILLFSSPVGRQEFENINFLRKHGLMPGKNGLVPRAIRLPDDPRMAAELIWWGVNSGVFEKMSSKNFQFSSKAVDSGEVEPNGSSLFWHAVEKEFA